ncbi:MAG: DUF202 domain-containing protein [Usitatibacter sp.]
MNDPRVFFAAERTLLAWLRTGLTIIAIGFMVARFGLFVQIVSLRPQPHPSGISSSLSAGLGVTFVLVGSLAIMVAAIQHARFVATLSPPDLPPAYSRNVSIALALVMATLGITLAAYLLLA